MATLTGKITDVTGRAPDSISSITVKAPSVRVGGGAGLIVSSPATVDFDRGTGDVTISGLTGGLSWLYMEGDGWSDSIALSVADGMITLVEAVANAVGVPGMVDYVRLLDGLENRVDDIAQGAVDFALRHTTDHISYTDTRFANQIVRLNNQGKLFISTESITGLYDPVNKQYADGVVGTTSDHISYTDDRFANQIVRLNDKGKLHITTAGITGLNDPVNKQYVDDAIRDSGGGQTLWWN